MTFGRGKFGNFFCIGYIAVCLQFVDSSYNIALRKPVTQSSTYGGWGAYKAVDGVIGKDLALSRGGSCSSTNPTGSREAWWRVDLQQMSRIKTINVTYRELYPFRLSGFYLYISNVSAVDNLPNTAHLCYHDDTKDPELPSFNQSRSCPVDGRYVIFYNRRPADNGPKSHRYYSTIDAVVEVCEVQVFGCPIKHYGLGNCDRTCHCGVRGCDSDTGQCDVTGCQSGWMGPTCSEECGSETFGMNCNQTCHCSTPGCNRVTGICTVPGCVTGWQGHACVEACGANRFGNNCFETCHCALSGCDRFSGTCTQPGCEPGWTGVACDKVCTVGHFGKDCSQTCHCATRGCDIFSGLCNHTGCDAGWEGPRCDKACDRGRYGKDCKYTCNCATPGCDAITGDCNVPGCEAGWQGSTCDIACNITSFGSNCDTICHCAKPGCDRFTGLNYIVSVCTVGHFGKDCSQTCHCATPGCDRFSGLCNHTGCEAGWEGHSCDKACGTGRYGKDCKYTCNCATPGCDAITGDCTVPGCEVGWQGSTCDIGCNIVSFGSNCDTICHCAKPGCDRFTGLCNVTGCDVGWTGSACDQVMTAVDGPISSEKSGCNALVVYAILGSLLCISVGFNIGFLIYILRTRRKRPEGAQPDNEMQYQDIANVNENYDNLDTSKVNRTKNIYDTMVK